MSWRKVLTLGGVASAIAIGCTVSVGDGSPDGSTGGKPGTGGSSTGGASAGDASTGTGGKGGASTGGTSTGGKGGASTGGKAGAGTGGAPATVCMPDKAQACDYCIETKCCEEWLDCVNDADCLQKVDGMPEEYYCIQDCILNDGGAFPSLEECAGICKHDPVGVSAATSGLLGCMRDTNTGDASTTQNCTEECFNREL